LQKGYFNISSQFNYSVFSTDIYNNNWEKVPSYGYLSNTFIIPLYFGYGLTNNIQISIGTNYQNGSSSASYEIIDYYKPERTHSVKSTKISNGFSDFTFSLVCKLFDEKTYLPSMGLACDLTIPYGKSEPTSDDGGETISEATSLGCYELGVGYIIKKVFYPFSVSSSLNYSYSFPTDSKLSYKDTVKTHIIYGDYFNYNAALYYMPCDWISFGNTISFTRNGFTSVNNVKAEKNTSYFQWKPSLTFQIKNIRLTQGVSFYLIGKNTNTAPLAYISLAIKI
jgi:hypothetical protein